MYRRVPSVRIHCVFRIHRWDGKPLFISTLPDQIIDGPLEITMPFDKTRVDDFMNDYHPRILRWCAGRCRVGCFNVDVLLLRVMRLLCKSIEDCPHHITMLRQQ